MASAYFDEARESLCHAHNHVDLDFLTKDMYGRMVPAMAAAIVPECIDVTLL